MTRMADDLRPDAIHGAWPNVLSPGRAYRSQSKVRLTLIPDLTSVMAAGSERHLTAYISSDARNSNTAEYQRPPLCRDGDALIKWLVFMTDVIKVVPGRLLGSKPVTKRDRLRPFLVFFNCSFYVDGWWTLWTMGAVCCGRRVLYYSLSARPLFRDPFSFRIDLNNERVCC